MLDASGAGDGGSIEIGGGLRGAPIASPVLAGAGAPATAPLPAAKRTVVREGARLAANAGAQGDGGKVVVWAEEATGFRGAIEARGGAQAGNGGFAEVSGRRGLAFDGAVDLTAAKGATGTLLLDPDSVTIVADDADGAPQDPELLDQLIDANDAPASFTISAGAVAGAVATADTLIEARQTITQQVDLSLSGSNSLSYRTLTGDITLIGAVAGAGNALTIESGGDVTLGGLAVGALRVTGNDIGQTAGGVTVSGTTVLNATGSIALGVASNDFATVELSGGTVSLTDRNGIQLDDVEAAELTLAAGGGISQRSGTRIGVPGDSTISTTAGGITLTRPANDLADEGSGHAVSLAAPGAVTLVDTDSVALGASSGASLTVTADDLSVAGTLDFAGDVALRNGAGGLALVGVDVADLDPATFDLTDSDLAAIQAGRVVVTTSGTQGIEVRGVTLDTEGLELQSGAGPTAFTTAPTAVAGDLDVTAASISQDASGAVTVGGKTSLSAAGAIALANPGNDFDADAPTATASDEVNATGTAVTLADRDAVALGTITASSLTVAAGGSITDRPGKAIRVDGPTDLTAQNGAAVFDIALDGNGSALDRPHDFGLVTRGAPTSCCTTSTPLRWAPSQAPA